MEETTKDEVLEQKVEVNANVKPEKVLTKRVWLNGFKLFGKIAFAVIFSLFYFISMMFFISPKVDAKIFKFFGAKKAEEACYIRVYDKSQSKADLYNLILIESELENYDKELYYLNILMNDEEGTFDSEGNWIEVVTHDRPRREHVVIDENEKPTMESKPVQFSNPGFKEDGLWVEQCLGAKVIPKVELVLEDALGHRFTRWVDSIEASSGESFIGTSK